MEASPDTLKVDHHLKSCIYYEVLRKKPIFDSYRDFCDTVGKDAMEYPDFEFWYYRFYHGSRDFDYDRSADPEPKTLTDMPVELMSKIAGNLDPVERTRLRTMNHAIKDVADSFPPVFEKIDISIVGWSMNWTLDSKRFWFNNEGEKSKEDYIKEGLVKLAPVLKMPNVQVKNVSLTLFNETLKPDDLLPVPFSPKIVCIRGQLTNQVVEFLSAMTPGHLESIGIDMSLAERRDHYGRIFETDQFKQAENVDFKPYYGLNVEDLANFSHLKKFTCHLSSNNAVEDVLRIRDIILTFPKFKSCVLSFRNEITRFPIKGIADALGEEIPIGSIPEHGYRTITHRYSIPDSNECLKFKIKEEPGHCIVDIVKVC
ncbi:unnamed protein product [Caenorhabditis nigoni]